MLSPQLVSLELTAIPTCIRQIRVRLHSISCCYSWYSDTQSGPLHLSGAPHPPTASVMPVLLAKERSLELHTRTPTFSISTTCMHLPIHTLDDLFLPPSQEHFQQQHTTTSYSTVARQPTIPQNLDQSLPSSPPPFLLQFLRRKHKEL